jgi:hypothetical protein
MFYTILGAFYKLRSKYVISYRVSFEKQPSSEIQHYVVEFNRRFGVISSLHLLHPDFLLGLLSDSEDGGYMFLRNVGWLKPDYTTLYPRRQNSS